MKNDFNLCPMCGSKKIINHNNKKWTCSDCGFDLYCNVAAAVGVVIYDDDKNILLEIRAKEPRKGYLALPGGFVDADESAEEAVIRECKEEIGVEVKDAAFICTNPNTYAYKNIEYKTCDMFFAAKLPSQYKNIDEFIKSLNPQETEVLGLKSVFAGTVEAVNEIPFAFESAKKTMLQLINKNWK